MLLLGFVWVLLLVGSVLLLLTSVPFVGGAVVFPGAVVFRPLPRPPPRRGRRSGRFRPASGLAMSPAPAKNGSKGSTSSPASVGSVGTLAGAPPPMSTLPFPTIPAPNPAKEG